MKSIMSTLLATDDVASNYGCRLKPQLRAAIEADIRFPVHAASPLRRQDSLKGDLGENVLRLNPHPDKKQRSSA